MADADRRKPVQPAHASNQIGYGHVGTPTYDETSHSWTFLRRPNPQNTTPFELIREPIEIESSTANPPTLNNAAEQLAPVWLLKNVPEAAAVVREHRSDFIPDANPRNTTTTSSSIDFGNALVLGSDDVQSGLVTTPVSAIVNSNAPHNLVLSLLDRESVSVNLRSGLPFEAQLPRLSEHESVSWSTPGDPIHWICFGGGSSNHDASWLLVRRACFIDIFQPLFHRAKPRSFAQQCTSSSLDPNLVVEISCSATGGLPFADASLCPQNSRELVVVDIGGSWSVWRIQGTRSRSARVLYRARLALHGSIIPQPYSIKQFDGWHKAVWLSSGGSGIDRLLICNRQFLTLLDLQGRVISQKDVRIGSKSSAWVLDLVVASSNYDFFVSTLTHIFCITAAGNDDAPSSDLDSLAVLAYFNHARGSGDHSLKLHITQWGRDTWLFLSSDSHSIITVYRWSGSGADGSVLYSGSDAVPLPVGSTTDGQAICLSVRALQTDINDRVQRQHRGHFMKLFGQSRHGSLTETLYWVQHLADGGEESQHAIALPRSGPFQHQSAYRIATNEAEDDLTDFVVADDVLDKPDLPPTAEPDLLVSQISEMTLDDKDQPSRPHLRDMRSIYTALLRHEAGKETKTTLLSFLQAVEEFVDGTHTGPLHSLLLSDVPTTLPYVAEIEEDSRRLETWSRRHDHPQDHEGSSQSDAALDIRKPKTLLSIYDELVETWISPLSSNVTDRFRVQRERLLRQVALEIYLARTTADRVMPDNVTTPQHFSRNPDSTTITVPTLSEPGYQDVATSPTSESSRTALPQTQPAQSLLSSFTTFKPRKSSQMSSMANDILAHLPTSAAADPATYDYRTTELQLSLSRNTLATQNLDTKTRRRADRLARSHDRRQAQLAKAASAATTASVPAVLSSQLPTRGAQSSQVPPSSSQLDSVPWLTMTQPERGAHGTRDAKKSKAKGKGRQKGF